MKNKDVFYLLFRYIFLLLLSLGNLLLIYLFLEPLTLYPVYFLLSLLYSNVHLVQGASSIFAAGDYIVLVEACIAGAAYYLLLILNLTTPMPARQRVRSLVFSIGMFLIINITRIVIFSYLFISDFPYFDLTHRSVWYFGSTLVVVVLWAANLLAFNIKGLPVLDDMKSLYRASKKK